MHSAVRHEFDESDLIAYLASQGKPIHPNSHVVLIVYNETGELLRVARSEVNVAVEITSPSPDKTDSPSAIIPIRNQVGMSHYENLAT